jgi:hypothetical protein
MQKVHTKNPGNIINFKMKPIFKTSQLEFNEQDHKFQREELLEEKG